MKKKLSSILFFLLFAAAFCSFSVPAKAAGSLAQITKPADGATVTVGEDVELWVRFDYNTADFKELAAQYHTLYVQILSGTTVISDESYSVGNVDFTAEGRRYATLRFSKAGKYTVRIRVPGSMDVWDSITVTAQNKGDNGDEGDCGDTPDPADVPDHFPQGTDPGKEMNSYEIPGAYPESQNPGYHVKIDTNEITIDLAKNKIGRLGFTLNVIPSSGKAYYCDWTEDQLKKIIKFHAIGDDYIEYEGVGVGTTRLHVYIMVGLKRYDHQVVTIKVIDSSKTTADPAKPVKAGDVVKNTVSNGVYKVNSDKKTLTFTKPISKTKTYVKIPATVKVNGKSLKVTAIAANAFKGNKKLTKAVIGSNVTKIGTNAFYGCTNLKTVTMGSKVATIGDRAFKSCKSLTSITIPAAVKKIGKQAFYSCKKLKKIVIKTKQLTSSKVGSQAFKGTPSKAVVYVPKAKYKTYKALLIKKGISKKASWKKQ